MRIFTILFLAVSSFAGDLFVFSRDGQTGTCSPRELPSVGQRLDNPSSVVILHVASDSERAACGWYRVASSDIKTPAGYRVLRRAFAIENGVAIERCTFTPLSGNIELSKYKLLVGIEQIGALDGFVAYLNADPKRKLLWDAATTLDSTNELVISAVNALGASYGHREITNLMFNARIKK